MRRALLGISLLTLVLGGGAFLSSEAGRRFSGNFRGNLLDSFGREDHRVADIPVRGADRKVPAQSDVLLPAKKGPPVAGVKKAGKDTNKKEEAPRHEDRPQELSAPPEIKTKDWCKWKTFGLPRGDIIINEVAWMGSPDDPDAEWLELKNISGVETDMRDWQIISSSGKIKIRVEARIIQPGEFQVLELGDAKLRDSGEWLKFFSRECELKDELNAESGWPAGDRKKALTMERRVGGNDWQASNVSGGSPGAQNHVLLSLDGSAEDVPSEDKSAEPAQEKMVIAWLQISGAQSDDDRIALYNRGGDAVDISGWKLRKRTKSGSESSVKVLSGEVGSGEYFIWANSRHPQDADATSTATISSDNSVALFNAEDAIVDAVAWGGGHVHPYQEGEAYPENPEEGRILGRKWVGGSLEDSGSNSLDFELRNPWP